MINSNVSKVKTYVGTDGKLHFVNSVGADTALNFRSIESVQIPSGLVITSVSAYRSYTLSCSSYFTVGVKKAIFYGDCVDDAAGNKGNKVSAKLKVDITNASGTILETKSLTINQNNIVTFNWSSYNCDFIIATVTAYEPSVTYHFLNVSIITA